MPKKPDAGLEPAIVDSALSLLDEGGMEAIRMRAVALRANTTTPTLYERFRDREDLLWAVVARIQNDMFLSVADAGSIVEMAEIVIDYFARLPGRLELMNHFWPKILASDRPKPVVDLAQRKFPPLVPGRDREYSVAALLMGTALLIRVAGTDSSVAKGLKQSSLKAIEILARQM